MLLLLAGGIALVLDQGLRGGVQLMGTRAALTASILVFVIRDNLRLRLLTLHIVLNSAPGFRLRA